MTKVRRSGNADLLQVLSTTFSAVPHSTPVFDLSDRDSNMAFTLVRHCTALRVFANFPTRSIPTASTSSLLASRPLLNPTPGHAVRSYAKKSKKGKNNKDDDDDEGTTVIKTKGKGSAKNSVSMSSSKKSKGDLVAGEEPIDLGDVDAVEAHDEALVEKMKLKMEKSVSWCRGVVYDGVERGSGRVSPGMCTGRSLLEGRAHRDQSTTAQPSSIRYESQYQTIQYRNP
jgi:hypothetical protein